MSTTIVSNIGNLPQATGMGQQTHVIYAVNSARWWLFHMASTTSVQSWYSSDGVTWTQGATLTLVNASTGDGRDFSVAYKNIASTDVVHLTYNNGGSSWQQYHGRGTISGTTLTWGSFVSVAFGAGSNGQTEPSGITLAIDSNNKVWNAATDQADFFVVQSTVADTGASWSESWPGSDTQVIGNNIVNWTHTRVLISFAASGKVLGISGNANTGSSDNAYYSNLYGGSTWGGEVNISFSDTNAQGPNEWCACRLSDTDVHMVKLTGTVNNTFEHRRFNGTSWGAGQSIPSLTIKADSGMAMASDGTSVWLFVIAGDAANTVKYIKWTSGSWGTWTSLETSSQTRNDISVCPSNAGGAWQVIWTETVTAGSQYNLVGIQLSTGGGGPTTITLTESGTGADDISVTGTIPLPTDGATGSESIVIGIPFSESGTGNDAIDFTSITAALADSGSGSDALAATISAPQTDPANGSDNITQVTVTLPLPETAAGLDAIAIQVSSIPLAESGNGAENATAAVTLTLTDPATGTELSSVQATVALPADTATGSDSVGINTGGGAITLTDLASGAETLALGPITPTLPQPGTGSDVIQITMPLALADNGSGAEVLTSQVTAALAEAGTASDGISISTSIPLADSGTGSENVVLGTLSIPLSELGTGSDAVTVVVGPHASDAATATDAVTLATIAVSLINSGTGAEMFQATVIFSLPLDAATGADAVNVSNVNVNVVTITDLGTGVEHVTYTPVEYVEGRLYTVDGAETLYTVDSSGTLYAVDATATLYAESSY